MELGELQEGESRASEEDYISDRLTHLALLELLGRNIRLHNDGRGIPVVISRGIAELFT